MIKHTRILVSSDSNNKSGAIIWRKGSWNAISNRRPVPKGTLEYFGFYGQSKRRYISEAKRVSGSNRFLTSKNSLNRGYIL